MSSFVLCYTFHLPCLIPERQFAYTASAGVAGAAASVFLDLLRLRLPFMLAAIASAGVGSDSSSFDSTIVADVLETEPQPRAGLAGICCRGGTGASGAGTDSFKALAALLAAADSFSLSLGASPSMEAEVAAGAAAMDGSGAVTGSALLAVAAVPAGPCERWWFLRAPRYLLGASLEFSLDPSL
eukprot:CAMPEP_0114251624 /NCGR_PEP_ID=MMETSP0058-20121206/15374_1 /TAXON_ID=36894 /ORGANISM="Pyramimonas parkeae, CCMP726" /LENGTH=183 /DNA_ID=CAMNT_0001365447 /DNA_START=191 /DNA_END=742 /DNA_ORIENTATION=+